MLVVFPVFCWRWGFEGADKAIYGFSGLLSPTLTVLLLGLLVVWIAIASNAADFI
jgi:hypothetical protein